jgi:hypothetical protein
MRIERRLMGSMTEGMMMKSMRSMIAVALAVALPLGVTTLVAGPVAAMRMTNEGPTPMDPLVAWSEQQAPHNTFYLNSSDDVELVRFKQSHALEICAAQPDQNAVGSARHGYPLKVSWAQQNAVVTPGNCLHLDAQRMKVQPAAPLPQDVVLTGTVRVLN